MADGTALSEFGLRADQETFVHAYVKLGSIEAAARECGRRPETGRKWAKDPKVDQAIQSEARQRLNNGAVAALNVLREIMDGSDDDKLRLQAAKDFLDRGGYKPEMLHTTADRRMDQMSVRDMAERINELCRELGVEAPTIIDVTPTAPAPPSPGSPDPLGESTPADQSGGLQELQASNPAQDTTPAPRQKAATDNPDDDTDIMAYLDDFDPELEEQ